MATTQDVILDGNWTLIHTSTADNTIVILTPHNGGVNWATRDDTTPPADSFKGHVADVPWDREFVLANGESFFIRGKNGRTAATTITPGS